MRAKVPKKRQHRSRGVSLPPDMEKAALRKAATLGMGFSRYVQRLIEEDARRQILTPIPQEAA